MSPAHAAVPANGSYNCNSGLPSSATPNYIITDGAVSAGSACVGVVVIPNGVTVIDVSAFQQSETLTGINLPASVTTIRDGAFQQATALTSITLPTGLSSMEQMVFYGATALTSIRIPDGITSIGNSTFAYDSALTSVTLPSGLTSIELNAFYENTSLTNITIPDGVTDIGEAAFAGNTSLISVTLPAGLTSLGSRAFSNNTSLTSITIPAGITSIEDGTFAGGTALTSVTLPAGLTNISRFAFADNTSLATITIPDGVASIGEGAFAGDTALSSITIPASVTQIDSLAFRDSFGLMTITFLGPIDAGSKTNGTILLPLPQRAHYTLGWYADSSFQTKLGDGGSKYSVVTATTMYARWNANERALATAKPTITGKAIATSNGANKLSASKGTWTGIPTPVISYQWYSCTGNVAKATSTIPKTCTRIAKATQPTLKVTLSFKKKFIAVAVTGKSAETTATTWLSKSTAQVK